MDQKPPDLGYEFEPSRDGECVGYASLRVVLSASPSGRFFDARTLHLLTFDGRSVHPTKIVSSDLIPPGTRQVCLGQLTVDSYRGEVLHVISFGGELRTHQAGTELLAEVSSSAPLLRLPDKEQGDHLGTCRLFVEEVLALLAEAGTQLPGRHEDLCARLAGRDPYQVFLSCLVSLERRMERLPDYQQPESYQQAHQELHRAIHAVREADGWDGRAPGLDELLGG